MAISRRNFLRGASACAVAAALPVPVLSNDYWPAGGPIFKGSIGVYQGVILREMGAREVFDLNACARRSLVRWYAERVEVADGC